METTAKQAIAISRMADAMEKYGVQPLIVDAARVIAGRKATEAVLGTVK